LLEQAGLLAWVRCGLAELVPPYCPQQIPDGMNVLEALVHDFALLTPDGLAELHRQVRAQTDPVPGRVKCIESSSHIRWPQKAACRQRRQ